MILDTHTMKTKYETSIVNNEEITFPQKDQMKITFPSYNNLRGYVITLK